MATPTPEEAQLILDAKSMNMLKSGSPPVDWNPVVPHDANAQTGFPCRCLRATVAGNIAVLTVRGNGTARVMAFAAGETRHGIFLRVMATGTTATGIEAGS